MYDTHGRRFLPSSVPSSVAAPRFVVTPHLAAPCTTAPQQPLLRTWAAVGPPTPTGCHPTTGAVSRLPPPPHGSRAQTRHWPPRPSAASRCAGGRIGLSPVSPRPPWPSSRGPPQALPVPTARALTVPWAPWPCRAHPRGLSGVAAPALHPHHSPRPRSRRTQGAACPKISTPDADTAVPLRWDVASAVDAGQED